MTHMRTRIFSILLTCAMLLSLLPATALAAEGDVAEVDGTGYATLAGAVEAAASGQTVKLLTDTDISTTGLVIPSGKSLTLDLNGQTIKAASTKTGKISVYGTLTIQDSLDTQKNGSGGGKIYTETNYNGNDTGYSVVDSIGEDAMVTLESGYIYAVRTDATNKGQFGLGVDKGGDVTITGGKVEAGWYAVSGNGNNKTQNSVINIQGGELISTADYAVYLPQSGITNISGGIIYGAAGGVSVQRGTVNISGDALITSKGTGDTGDWGDGTGGQDCAALNVSAEYGDCTVSISGGTLMAKKEAGVIASGSPYRADISITGGTFSSDVRAYVDRSSNVTEGANGNFVIIPNKKEDGVAEIDGKYYKTLGDAIASVGDGDTIQVLKDIPDAVGISVPSGKNFTIDFGGYTYTLTGPGAGSPNTETNGFQLLKDSTITMKNGTIRIAEDVNNIKRIIQNYADLTLENMQFYAKNQVDGEDYALSFNNGNVTFKGTTSVITSSSSNVAFDVCKFSDYPGATVTFDESYTGTVNGQIVYNSTDATTHKLIIEGNGTFGTIIAAGSATEAAKNGITISGGHFAQPVNPDYLHESLNTQLKSASNPEAPYSYYTSMDDAIAAAKPGDVVIPIPTDPATKTYTVTLDYNDGRTGNVTCTVKEEDTSISLPRPTRSGYNFLGWYAGSTKVSSPYKVTGNVTLVAQWSYIDQGGTTEPSGEYLVNVDRTTGGKVTVNPGRADKGDTVTITVKPNDGYVLDELTVTAKDGGSVKLTWKDDNKYTFTMPGSRVTVEATFVKEGGQTTTDLPFTDVAEGDWYYDAVQYVYENDLMNGTSATTFSPFVTTSRAMMLTILARYDGVDTSTGSTWYEGGAVWAIAEGVSDGTNLEANLTREQLVTMLWRYAGSPVVEGDLADYPDSASVSDWAVNAMIWAVENGVITGNGAGALNPQGTATRAEVATILMRFIEN